METIEEILRDIRSRNDGGVPLDGESSHCLAADMLELANRIEAAHKSEAVKYRHALNAAKMREALEAISDKYRKWLYAIDLRNAEDVFEECDKLADEALSNPPRNCDLYKTEEEAWEAFCDAHPDAECPSDIYEMWLFDQAKGEIK